MMMMGRNTNGRLQWKTADGRTLKEIQEEELGDVTSSTTEIDSE
jgi:hypothetical protein